MEGDARQPRRPRLLSVRFSAALSQAAELHARQRRKKIRDVPYVSHLLAVTSGVLDDGGTEDEAIAALFHDSVEDQGVAPQSLADDYGSEVARIVVACSDAVGSADADKPPWLQRKKAHLDHLRTLRGDTPVLRVTASDKLHNCSDIVLDLGEPGVGPERFDLFKGGVHGTCWYYAAMAELLLEALPSSRLTAALRRSAIELHEAVGVPYPAPEPETL
jgi:hypothetical protein